MATSLTTITASRLGASARILREGRGLSAGALARKTGLSKTSISNIESGDANPSLETLVRLSEALNVGLSVLLGVPDSPELHVIRAGEGEPFESPSGIRGRVLIREGQNHRSELLEIFMEPGADYSSGAHPSGTEEVIVCVSGDVLVGPRGVEVRLQEGDTVRFAADAPHRYRTTKGLRAILIMRYAAARSVVAPVWSQSE